jgi:8-oxo-dGTP diphosphatase
MKQPKRCNCDDIPENTYHKIAAVIVKNGKTLVVKMSGLDEFISLGGKHEGDETHQECLNRESLEELSINVFNPNFLGRFEDVSVLDKTPLIIDAYLVETKANPEPANEIEDYLWVGKTYNAKLASVLEKYIIPELDKKGLIQ